MYRGKGAGSSPRTTETRNSFGPGSTRTVAPWTVFFFRPWDPAGINSVTNARIAATSASESALCSPLRTSRDSWASSVPFRWNARASITRYVPWGSTFTSLLSIDSSRASSRGRRYVTCTSSAVAPASLGRTPSSKTRRSFASIFGIRSSPVTSKSPRIAISRSFAAQFPLFAISRRTRFHAWAWRPSAGRPMKSLGYRSRSWA
ncbi:MAG: hypothetical protein E6K17_07005, partial [Methanobacteriota archaeon]